jgi:hypothetical protein
MIPKLEVELPCENFTLGQTKNLNLIALSPQAFSSSVLSSLSKEILSNGSSTHKHFALVSFQAVPT